nr:hypothetical protein [uncultured Acetatifactor sp.]
MFYGEFIREVEELNKKTDGLYIYGAGLRGKELCHILTRNHIRIEGFIVTQAETEAQALGFPIITASTVMYDNIGIIIGLGDLYNRGKAISKRARGRFRASGGRREIYIARPWLKGFTGQSYG